MLMDNTHVTFQATPAVACQVSRELLKKLEHNTDGWRGDRIYIPLSGAYGRIRVGVAEVHVREAVGDDQGACRGFQPDQLAMAVGHPLGVFTNLGWQYDTDSRRVIITLDIDHFGSGDEKPALDLLEILLRMDVKVTRVFSLSEGAKERFPRLASAPQNGEDAD